MPDLQPDQAAFLLHMSLNALQNEHTITRRVIESIPLDKGGYRPDDISKTALELAWHIVAIERRFLDAVASGSFDLTPAPMPEAITNSAELAAWYGDMFAEKTAPLRKLTPEQLLKIIDFRGKFQRPAVMYVQFVTSHTIHHRGQLSTYLRPMGAKVPAMYGESYDSAQAQKA